MISSGVSLLLKNMGTIEKYIHIHRGPENKENNVHKIKIYTRIVRRIVRR